jgi:hypothetical protein
MNMGHLGASYVAKAVDKRIPLWILFIATQALDIVWAVLVLLGIERARIVPGITAASPYDLYYYPYSHSLVASLLWMALAMISYRLLRPGEGSWRMGLIVGLTVFSHWVLDLLVHRPDLPLYDDTLKIGLGLWNFPLLSFLLETALLLGGVWLYCRVTTPVSAVGRYGWLVFSVLLIAILAGTTFGPPPPSAEVAAILMLVSTFAFTLVAYWLGKKRQ